MIIPDKIPSEISRAYQSQLPQVDERLVQGTRQTEQVQRDEVTFSAEAHVLQKAKTAAMEAPEVRTDRVNEVKRMIEEGTYQVPVESLVDRLLKGGYPESYAE